MIVYTIINDLGKIKSIVQAIQIDKTVKYGMKAVSHGVAIDALSQYAVRNTLDAIEAIVRQMRQEVSPANVDHDKVLRDGLEKTPHIAPSFHALHTKHKARLLTGLRAEFNMGQYLQLENVAASLEKLRHIDEESFDFYMIHFVYDLAGAAGQFLQNGSVVVNEPTYEGFEKGVEILRRFIHGDISTKEAYDIFLHLKAEKLGINIESPKEYTIVRICAMLRYSTPAQGATVADTFDTLPKNTRAILISEMTKSGIDDGFASLVYYVPAILVNLQKGTKDSKRDLEMGLTTLARIYQESRIALKSRKGNGVFTVMSNHIAAIAADPFSRDSAIAFGAEKDNEPSIEAKIRELKGYAESMGIQNPHEFLSYVDISLQRVGDDAQMIPTLQSPPIDTAKFRKISDLSSIPGDVILPIGMGGGSDCIQAAQLAKMLQGSGKTIPAVVSVRTATTGSQGSDGKMSEDRTPQNAQEISTGVYLVNKDTKMKGRPVEPLIADDFPTYIILIREDISLVEQIQALRSHLGSIDTIIGVDTGGDALFSTSGQDQAKATPDQDIQVLRAISSIQDIHVLSAEIAV